MASTEERVLDPSGLSLAEDEVQRERARVRGGVLSKLAALVLFSPKKKEGEPSQWTVAPLSILQERPVDCLADLKLSDEARKEIRTLKYKNGDVWDSAIFARIEQGVSPEEAAHALMPAFVRHKKYVEVLEMDSLLAYGNTVSNYYDCVFDAYDFPSKGKKYTVRKLSGTTGKAHVEAITAPSASDTEVASDTEADDEETQASTMMPGTGESPDLFGGEVVHTAKDAGGSESSESDADAEEQDEESEEESSEEPEVVDENTPAEEDPLDTTAEEQLSGIDIMETLSKLAANPSTKDIINQAFGPDSDDEAEALEGGQELVDDGQEQDTDIGIMAMGVSLDINDNEEIPAKECPTLRSRSVENPPKEAGNTGGGRQRSSTVAAVPGGSGGGTAAAGGSGGEPPEKPRGGKKKLPADKTGGSPKKKKRLDPDLAKSKITFAGKKITKVVRKGQKQPKSSSSSSSGSSSSGSSSGTPTASSSAASSPSSSPGKTAKDMMPPPRSTKVPKAKKPQQGTLSGASQPSASSPITSTPTPSTSTASTSTPVASTSSAGSQPLGPAQSVSQRPSIGGRKSGGVEKKSTSPKSKKKKKKSKKKRKKGADSSSSSSSASESEDDDDAAKVQKKVTKRDKISCGPDCRCESLSRVELKQQVVTKDMHLLMCYIDRCDLARHNQINSTKKYLKKLNKKMKAQSLAVREAKMAALEAATTKDIEEAVKKSANEMSLPWTSISQCQEACTKPAMVQDMVRQCKLLARDVDTYCMLVFQKFFDDKLIGRLYYNKAKVFKGGKRYFKLGEEYFYLPSKFLEIVSEAFLPLIPLADEAKLAGAIKKIDNYLAGRRTDQHRMAEATLYRREYRDEVCYWLLVHEEASLKVINGPVPFRGSDDPDEKDAWLDKYKDKISQAYQTKTRNKPPKRRNKEEGEDEAFKKQQEIRHWNYPGPLG